MDQRTPRRMIEDPPGGSARRRLLLSVAFAAPLVGGCGLLRTRAMEHAPYTTASGLLVQDVVVPEGERVERGDVLTIHYEGRLESGQVIDSSYQTGQPVRFELGAGDVPEGLEEGIVGMARGGRRRLVIPPELGYGADGVPGRVPPGASLVFEVELLEVEPASAPDR